MLLYVLLTGRQPFSSPKTDDPYGGHAPHRGRQLARQVPALPQQPSQGMSLLGLSNKHVAVHTISLMGL